MANTVETGAARANKPNVVEEFVAGAKKGLYVGLEMIAPAMVLAYVLILALKMTGLLDLIGQFAGPVMGIFGVPGEGVVVLAAAFFAKAAGCATAANLYLAGKLTAAQATILFPACITMGTLIGHFVRIIVVSNANKRWHPILLCVPLIDAVVVMFMTRAVLVFMGQG